MWSFKTVFPLWTVNMRSCKTVNSYLIVRHVYTEKQSETTRTEPIKDTAGEKLVYEYNFFKIKRSSGWVEYILEKNLSGVKLVKRPLPKMGI